MQWEGRLDLRTDDMAASFDLSLKIDFDTSLWWKHRQNYILHTNMQKKIFPRIILAGFYEITLILTNKAG